MKLNVDMNSPDDQGRTTLQVALERGKEEVVQILLQHGADAETQVRVPALDDPNSLYDNTQTQ